MRHGAVLDMGDDERPVLTSDSLNRYTPSLPSSLDSASLHSRTSWKKEHALFDWKTSFRAMPLPSVTNAVIRYIILFKSVFCWINLSICLFVVV